MHNAVCPRGSPRMSPTDGLAKTEAVGRHHSGEARTYGPTARGVATSICLRRCSRQEERPTALTPALAIFYNEAASWHAPDRALDRAQSSNASTWHPRSWLQFSKL